MKITKRHFTVMLSLLCAAALVVGSLAYFTDRIESSSTATAGTLDIVLDGITASKTSDLKPGEGVELEYTLSNDGNKSADVLETLVISSTKEMTDGANPAEFEIYNAADVNLVDGIANINPGAEPLTVRTMSTDRKQISYAVPQFILDGTGEGAETEPTSIGASKTGSYVLVFSASAGNSVSGAELTLYYEAQAKQHRNTNDATWNTIKTETVSFAGNNNHAAVPSAN